MKITFSWIKMLEWMAALFFVILFAVSVGSADLSIWDSFRLVLHKIPFLENVMDVSDIRTTYEIIVWKVRMPRVLLAALTGGALALVGAAFQGIFQNPLADPHILGVSSGAALGATIAMLSGISLHFFGMGTIGIFAFFGAMITIFLVYHVAKIGGQTSTTNLLLTGTAISTMLSAVISLLMTFHREQISKVYMWTMGSFSSATWEKVVFLVLFVCLGFIFLICYSGKLNMMMMGDEDAKALGLDTEKFRKHLIVICSFLVAAAVSCSGMIGFVGLIIPHCIRMVSGSDNRKLIPYVFFAGAVFLIICDTIARTIAAPSEIPVGVLTSLFGAPYFLFLLFKNRKCR